MNQSFTIVLLCLIVAALISSAPIPPRPQTYTANAVTTMDGVPNEVQMGIDHPNSRAYEKIILYGVLVGKIIIKNGYMYQVFLGSPGKNPFEYQCFKFIVPNPELAITQLDYMAQPAFATAVFVSQIGVKDPKKPPSIVLANTFNITVPTTTGPTVFFVNPADNSLLSVLGIGHPSPSNATINYTFNRWEEKVYDDDFDIPVPESQCKLPSGKFMMPRLSSQLLRPTKFKIPFVN